MQMLGSRDGWIANLNDLGLEFANLRAEREATV